jgi:hypothetical protein
MRLSHMTTVLVKDRIGDSVSVVLESRNFRL